MAIDTEIVLIVPEGKGIYPAIVADDDSMMDAITEHAQSLSSKLGDNVRIYQIKEMELLYKVTPEEKESF